MTEELSEWDVRLLRDEVMCDVISDVSWEQIKSHWLRPDSVAWLREKAKKRLTSHLPTPIHQTTQ